jgi:long-chain acyl-CoA synthetase
VTELRTLNDIFFRAVEFDLPNVAMHKRDGQWMEISSQTLYRSVVGVARTLLDWGIAKGDRVAILSENRPEWAFTDYACQAIGAVDVPIYPTLTAEQTAYILNDCGARAAVVSTAEQLKKILTIKDVTPVERIMVMDSFEGTEAVMMHSVIPPSLERDPEFDARARQAQPADLATIMYTSGTTGQPKGVMLTHDNLVSNVRVSLAPFGVSTGALYISYLPLSHITARHVDYVLTAYGVTLAYCPRIEQLALALQEARPTIFVGVPRVYEKFKTQVEVRAASGIKRRIYHWALEVGRQHREEILAARTPDTTSWQLANKMVFSKIRDGFGGRVQVFISGGAPLGRDLAAWYADVGIRIHEGYGLTETSPVIAVNTPQHHRIGTVGKPLPNLEVKIAHDGELLVRGPSVFSGYWKLPAETENAFADGFFKTGDIAALDGDGYLSITDRKKDLIKTSGGKFIAPQPIERHLKANALIAEVALVGDRRKFVCAIIAPHFPLLEDWAHANGVHFESREELVASEKVRALFQGIIGELNKTRAQFETIKKFLLVPDEFTVAGGELTASLKLRRRAVEEKYREQIEKLYAEAEAGARRQPAASGEAALIG